MFDSGRGVMTVLPLVWPAGRTVEQLAEVTREAMLRQYRRAGVQEREEVEVDVRELEEVEVKELEEMEAEEDLVEGRRGAMLLQSTGAGQTP